MICAFTGHRPERLPWGRNEDDLRCAALKTLLRRTVREVYDRGFHTFLCGMARGCDQYFAEAVLAAGRTAVRPRPLPVAAGRLGRGFRRALVGAACRLRSA